MVLSRRFPIRAEKVHCQLQLLVVAAMVDVVAVDGDDLHGQAKLPCGRIWRDPRYRLQPCTSNPGTDDVPRGLPCVTM